MTFYHWLALAFFIMVPSIIEHLALFFKDWEEREYPDDISGGNI